MDIACGVDIIEIDRIKRAVENDKERFLKKIFTPKEIDYCEGRAAAKYQHYAARFAAKEAVSKALGVGFAKGIWWTDIEVVNDPNGRPTVILYGDAKKIAQGLGIGSLVLSLSHCHKYAVANAACLINKV